MQEEYQRLIHFIELREKVLGNTASPEEQREYDALARSGEFETIDEQNFKSDWDADLPMTDEDRAIHKRIYADIFKGTPRKKTIRLNLWLAAAATALVFVVVGIYQNTNIFEDKDFTAKFTPGTHVFQGPQYVELPDNSTVELDINSHLTYNDGVFAKDREVTLSGTAFFEITHDPARPFKVRSGRVLTTVLGTAFNVSEDPANHLIEVTVVRGKVAVGDSLKTFEIVLPNQKVTVKTNDMMYALADNISVEKDLEWKKDNLVFNATPMHQAIDMIERRFGVEIILVNPALKNCLVEGWFHHDEKLSDVIDLVAAVHGASVVIEGHRVTIEGGKGCD